MSGPHHSLDDDTTAKKRTTPNTVPGGVEEPPPGGKKSRSNNHAAASNIAPKSFDYMCDDLPVLSLTDENVVEKIRTCVDNKCYPYDKYYSKLKLLSGPVQFAFFEMGWGENNLEHAHLRATGINAVIDVMAERVSDNRERSKARCKKKFLSKYLYRVYFYAHYRWSDPKTLTKQHLMSLCFLHPNKARLQPATNG